MPKHVEHLKIFLASPGDVQTERDHARQVIEEINLTIGRDKNVHLEITGWETDAYPSYGGDGQSLVNSQIADMGEYDLFLGIMWNRFGQPTPRTASGTEEEFNLAASSHDETGQPEIMLYFSQATTNISTAEQLDQKGKVIEFKDRVRSKALTWDYAGPQDFQELLQRHLSKWVLNHTRKSPRAPTLSVDQSAEGRTAEPLRLPSLPAPDAWLLLNETFYIADSVKTQVDGSITLRLQARDLEEEAYLRSLNPHQHSREGAVSYAYQNDGGLAEVKDVSMDSERGQTIFTVRLKMADTSQNGMMEASVNGFSADEIAAMRAKLLLLNELPAEQNRNNLGSVMHFIRGFQGSVKFEKGIFPDFWKHMREHPSLFVPLARLLAVYQLKASNTVEHIFDLSLGPVEGTVLPVRFRGQRKRAYSNSAPAIIEVNGKCNLT